MIGDYEWSGTGRLGSESLDGRQRQDALGDPSPDDATGSIGLSYKTAINFVGKDDNQFNRKSPKTQDDAWRSNQAATLLPYRSLSKDQGHLLMSGRPPDVWPFVVTRARLYWEIVVLSCGMSGWRIVSREEGGRGVDGWIDRGLPSHCTTDVSVWCNPHKASAGPIHPKRSRGVWVEELYG